MDDKREGSCRKIRERKRRKISAMLDAFTAIDLLTFCTHRAHSQWHYCLYSEVLSVPDRRKPLTCRHFNYCNRKDRHARLLETTDFKDCLNQNSNSLTDHKDR